jgi:lysozyme family protein
MITDLVFGQAVEIVLRHEGGLNDRPSDPGGLTNYGFALNRNPDLTADQIRNMTREQATERYLVKWWQPYRWRDLPVVIACKVFDCAVPDGPGPAIRALQRACWASGQRVKEDGALGSETIRAAGYVSTPILLAALKSELAAHFRLVAAAKPAQSGDLPGWLNRAYE